MIEQVLAHGDVVESTPNASPHPKCLMMDFVAPDKPMYVSAAFNQSSHLLYIITVHWFDPKKWVDPWTRR